MSDWLDSSLRRRRKLGFVIEQGLLEEAVHLQVRPSEAVKDNGSIECAPDAVLGLAGWYNYSMMEFLIWISCKRTVQNSMLSTYGLVEVERISVHVGQELIYLLLVGFPHITTLT